MIAESFLTSFSTQKLRQIEDLKEQQRSGKTLEKNQVCYGLCHRLLNKIIIIKVSRVT